MSLYQSPSVLSVEIQAARRYLREFNILVVSQIRHGDLLELRAQHENTAASAFPSWPRTRRRSICSLLLCRATPRAFM